MGSRTKVLLAIVVVAVAAGFVGWYAGQQIKSPEQIAAETAPPEASLITVPVESRTLSRDVITRTDAAFQDSNDLTLNLAQGGSTAVVTGRVPTLGDLLEEGAVGIEVAGRPVFILDGDLPSFRSMGPGTVGVDVLQLEEALLRLGYFTGVADDLFDQDTEAALERMYVESGYQPPELTEAEQSRLDMANNAIEMAEDSVESAQDRLVEAQEQAERSESQLFQQGQQLVGARDSVANAEYQLIQVNMTNPLSEINSARSAAAAATAEESRVLLLLADARQRGLFGDALASFEADADQASRARQEAEAMHEQLNNARANALRQANAGVVSARNQLAAQELSAREAGEPVDLSSESDAITDAEEALEEARADLLEIEGEIGTVFPQSEFLFLKNLPRLVSRVDIEPGQIVSDSIMRISGADVTFSGGIPEISRQYVAAGATVLIEDAPTAITIEGVITELAETPGTNGEAASRYYFEIMPNGTFDAEEVVNVGNFKLTIPIERTEGEVLAVPVAALSAAADGSSRVEVVRDGNNTELVTVVVGLEADGFAEIDPVQGELVAGEDRVVIGVDRTGGGSEDDGE